MKKEIGLRWIFMILLLFLGVGFVSAVDPELTNYKSGINVNWSGTKGTDYCEEYLYHDKLIDDHKVVYLRNTTNISMEHNERNTLRINGTGGMQIIGKDGQDNLPDTGDEGIIRYKIDRDRQYYWHWADRTAYTFANQILPAYTTPFNLSSQFYNDSGVLTPVVRTIGDNGASYTSRTDYYYRGINDSFGDEWHVLAYADDDNLIQRNASLLLANAVQSDWYASDGKTVLLVVDPKTPCLTARASGGAQFYTTPAKAYFTPKVVNQTTYFMTNGSSSNFTIELRDIYGNNIRYRINGGSFNSTSSSSIFLTEGQFNNGTNTLEYYYGTNTNNIKTRTVVKNPGFPSGNESHGNFLWVDQEGYNAVLDRLTRNPYKKTYDNYRTRAEHTYSGQTTWDTYAYQGHRFNGGVGSLNGNSKVLVNAFVANVSGFNYTMSGKNKSFGIYAKEMLIDNPRTIDNVGFEMIHTDDSIPSRELNYRGYYDSNPLLDMAFAYDIIVANFKNTQVTEGITPIEDYFVRDKLAGFSYDAMMWSADLNPLGHPLMWGGARMMTSTVIGMVMPNYSTSYYGTSGFGAIQTTYPLAPYQNDQLTWKEAFFDYNMTKTSYPDYTWGVGFSDNVAGSNIVLNEGDVVGGHAYSYGTWRDKASYFNPSLMGEIIATWANMARLHGGNKSDPRLEVAFIRASNGSFIGAVDEYPQTPRTIPNILLLNDRWPDIYSVMLSYVKALPSSDSNSLDKRMNVYGFAWYDDGYEYQPITVNLLGPDDLTKTSTNLTSLNASFFINASISNSSLSNITFYIWNSSQQAINQTFYLKTGFTNSSNVSFVLPYQDAFKWNYLAYDNSSNSSWALANFTLIYDTFRPTINLTSPANASSLNASNSILFNATFYDNVALANATLYVWNSEGTLISISDEDDITYSEDLSGREDTASISLSLPGSDTFYWNYIVSDLSGNESSGSSNFTLIFQDIASPLITIDSPLNQTYSVNEIEFAISSDEVLSSCRFSLNNWAQNYTMSLGADSDTATYTNSTLSELTNYTARFSCNDTYNNFNMTSFVNFSIGKVIHPNFTQQGEFNFDGVQTLVQVDPINMTETFLYFTPLWNSTAGVVRDIMVLGEIVNSTTLKFSRTAAEINDTLNVSWQLITDDRLRVERGNISLTTSSETNLKINLSSSFNLSQSFATLSLLSSTSGNTAFANSFWSASFVNSTQLQLFRNASTETSFTIHYQAIQWTGANVQSGTAEPNNTLPHYSINSVNLSNTFLFFTHTAQTSYITNSSVHGRFVNASTLSFEVMGTIVNNIAPTISYFVISHPSFIVQSGQTQGNSATTNHVNISTFNVSRGFAIYSSKSSSTAGTGGRFYDSYSKLNIFNSTQLRFQLGQLTQTNNISWFAINIQDDLVVSGPDATVPSVTLLAPINGTNISTASTSFNATMTDNVNLSNATLYVWNSTGIVNQTTYVRIGTSNFTNTTFSFPRNGSYIWNYFVVDNSSNSAWATANFTINYDAVRPNVNLIVPINGTNVTSASVSFNATFTDNYFLRNATLFVWNASNSVLINQTNRTLSGISGSINISFTLPHVGTFIWNYFVVDALGNFAFNNTNYTINYSAVPDTTQPAVAIVYPTNTTYNTNVSAINYTASDTNLAYCWYSNETTNFTQTSCGTNFTGVITREGSNRLIVYANDSSGNINSTSVTFFKDTAYPQFTNYTSNSGTLTTSGTGTFNVTVANSNGTVLMQINGVNYTASNLTATNYNVSVTLTSAGSYTYYWYSFSNSSLRNFNSSTAQTYTVNSATSDSGSSGSSGGGGGGGGGGASTSTTTNTNTSNTTSSGSSNTNTGNGNANTEGEGTIEFGETGSSGFMSWIRANTYYWVSGFIVFGLIVGGIVYFKVYSHREHYPRYLKHLAHHAVHS